MVIVAELVKHLIVVQAIVGSSPTFHTELVFVFFYIYIKDKIHD